MQKASITTMKNTTYCVVIFLILCGCATRQDINKNLTATGEAAFKEWQHQKKATGDKTTIIQGPLSLEKALKLSLTYNRELQAIVEEKNVAKGRILEAYGGVLPNVTLNGNYTRQDRDSKKIEGTTYPLGQKDNYEGVLSVTQPLYRGGAATAALRASRFYDALTDENVRGAVQKTMYETIRAYRQTQLVREQMKVTTADVALAEAHLKDVTVKRRFGTASDFNVLRSQVDLSNAQAEMISFQNKYNTAVVNLLQVIGMSQESRIEPTESLVYEPLTVEEETAIHEAFRNRPDLAAADLSLQLQNESLNVAKSGYLPQINAFYSYVMGKPDPYILTNDDWENAWFAGINVTIPIFDGLVREGRVTQEKASVRKREIGLVDARERALFEVRTAILNLRDADESVNVQKLTVEQAQEGLRLAEVGYREGILDQVSVLDARSALTKAQLLYYKSLFDHALARLDLHMAMGILSSDEKPQGTEAIRN
jgi:outer membrane protein